ncbi:MAG: TonB-dependent receptor [Bacteroidales bacterium]|nr:TonB-dependent receptor [Bacteroidales bacterium]
MAYTIRVITLVLYLVPFVAAVGQDKCYQIRDKYSGEPICFATLKLCSEGKTMNILSDKEGKFCTDVSQPVYLEISGMGYKTLSDTLTSEYDNQIELIPDLLDIEEVVITGQVTPRRCDQSVYKVTLLSKKDIEHKAAVNLSGLLMNELNINLMQQNVLGRTISIRGLGGEHIKILYNGMPVSGRQLGIIDLDQIGIHHANHIEIIEGPLSVIYGSNALGGAINIITQAAAGKKLKAEAGINYETAGIYNMNLNLFYGLKKHCFGLNMARNFFAGFNPDKNSRFDVWKPKLQYMPGVNYAYRGNKIQADVYVDFLHEELRDKDSLSRDNLYESADDRYYFTKRLNLGLSIGYRFSPVSAITAQAGFSVYNRAKNSYHINLVDLEKHLITDPSMHDTTNFRMISGRLAHTFRLKNLEIITGTDMNYENGYGKRLSGEKSIGDYALFSSFIWDILSGLQIQPGLRVSYNTRYKPPLIYSFNLKYNLAGLKLRASVANGFRTPSLKELYMEFLDQNHRVFGNQNLKAETAHNYNISVSYIHAAHRFQYDFSGDFFLVRVKNKIDFLFDYDQSGKLKSATYFNLPGSLYQTKGIALNTGISYKDLIHVKTGIALTAISSPGNLEKIDFSPDVTAKIQYNVHRKYLSLVAYYKYTGKKYFYKNNIGDATTAAYISKEYTDPYHNVDISLNGRFLSQDLRISAGCRNLLNNITVFSTASASIHGVNNSQMPVGWGRTFFIRVNYILKSKSS